MKSKWKQWLGGVVVAGSIFAAAPVHAVPVLQLTILGGTYDNADESTHANTNPFTLVALLKGSAADLATTYFISLALFPTSGSPSGSISVGGLAGFSNLTATQPLHVGTPSGLPSHGVFPAQFAEVSFNFSGLTTNEFDAQTTTPSSITGPCNINKCLYYASFSITDSMDNASIHFDLYGGGKFAPFSHDAQSGRELAPCTQDCGDIPEPGTLAMLGLGAVVAAAAKRRRRG